MKTKKHIYLAITAAFIITSCSDFLDDQQEGSMPAADMDYTKSENIFKPVSAAYASMRNNGAHGFNYVGLCEISADNADKGSEPDDNPPMREIDNFSFTPSNGLISEIWVAYYGIVSSANNAISQMPLFVEAQQSQENKHYAMQCEAEAKTIRAYAYFNLVRLFGRVPIVDTLYTADQLASLKQAEQAETYAFIQNDLREAVQLLPESYSKEYAGRITKYTAMAIKAKVHLYMAEYDSVAYYTNEIIKSGRFNLLPDYRTVFRSDGENSRESLFEIQSSTIGKSTGDAPYLEYAFVQGPRNNQPSNMQGWGYCTPSASLIAFLNNRSDVERAKVILMQRGTIYEGDSIMSRCSNEYYNGKVFSPSSENKWNYNGYGFDYNVRILRYADILLMHAEALKRGAAVAAVMSADDAINKIRDRVNLSTPGGYSLDQILDERRAEMAMEEDRFFDLVRTGKAASVLGPLGFKSGKNEVYPIPATQMQINLNLVQNPGYN